MPLAPSTSLPPPKLPAKAVAETRAHVLREELSAATAPQLQALLHQELGALSELRLHDVHTGIQHYLEAHRLDPSLRAPLWSLGRLFLLQGSRENLLWLHEAEQRTASDPVEEAAAVMHQAVVLEDFLHRPHQAGALLQQAFRIDPSHRSAAWMLEMHLRGSGSRRVAERVLEARARFVGDPALKAALLVEVAEGYAARGDVDHALGLLRGAATLQRGGWQVLQRLERMARVHGRMQELLDALEGRAAWLSGIAYGELVDRTSGSAMHARFETPQDAVAHAAAVWGEIARLQWFHREDANDCANALAQGLALRADDAVLQTLALHTDLVCGQWEGAQTHATELLRHARGRTSQTGLQTLLARLALLRGDRNAAWRALEEARAVTEDDVVAMALRRWLQASEPPQRRLQALQQSAEELLADAERAEACWQAGLTASELGDLDSARDWIVRAAAHEPIAVEAWRDLYGLALHARRGDIAQEAIHELTAHPLEPAERSALVFQAYRRLRGDPSVRTGSLHWLRAALSDPHCEDWAPDTARVAGALQRDPDLLVAAHRRLADIVEDAETRAAHLCAAARARARERDTTEAEALLREALAAAHDHAYALTLLEELLGQQGRAEEAIELARRLAASQTEPRARERTWMVAAAHAEAGGDVQLAIRTYRGALQEQPAAWAPAWNLRRLAWHPLPTPSAVEREEPSTSCVDAALMTEALEALARCESLSNAPGWAHLELALDRRLGGDLDGTLQALEPALPHPVWGIDAAVALLALPDIERSSPLRARAWRRLADESAEGSAWSYSMTRGAASSATATEEALPAASKVLAARPEDPWGWCARLLRHPDAAARIDSYTRLGELAEDPQATDALLLHGARGKALLDPEHGTEDAVLIALSLAAAHPDRLCPAVAVDEALGPADDAELRAEALRARAAEAAPTSRGALQAARARALVHSEHPGEAADALRVCLDADPEDLASWEALRVAARRAHRPEQVVEACSQLAAAVDGTWRARLLEEAGVVLEDELEQRKAAEARFRDALQADPASEVAFHRLHAMLAIREDNAGLIGLVATRAEAIEAGEEQVDLRYEHARLLRALGRREETLDAIEQVCALEPEHLGALALGAEVESSLQRWSQAVTYLSRLAECAAPQSQRRLARLGAADLLEHRLEDWAAALRQLDALAKEDDTDPALHGRRARLALYLDRNREALDALERAAELAEGRERTQYLRNAAEIRFRRLHESDTAIDSCRRALEADPTDLESCRLLRELEPDPEARERALTTLEQAVREVVDARPWDVDSLAKLLQAARWRGDADRERRVQGALLALDANRVDSDEAADVPRDVPSGSLSEAGLAALRPEIEVPQLDALAASVTEAALSMERNDPERMGLTRRHRVPRPADHPVATQLQALARILGARLGEVYVGGEPDAFMPLPRPQGPWAWVVGTDVTAPLSVGQRFDAGLAFMAQRHGVWSLAQRSPARGATLIVASLRAAGASLPPRLDLDRPDIQSLTQAVAASLPRRTARSLRKLAERHGGRAGDDAWFDNMQQLERYCWSVRQMCRRAGLLVADDIGAALRVPLGARGVSAELVATSSSAADLLRFWLSCAASSLVSATPPPGRSQEASQA